MAENYKRKVGPLVSVLVPTFNRPGYLSEALASTLHQSYRNLQVIVINDGGDDVSDVVNSFGDTRITFIDEKENHGKAFCLNRALNRAEGKYVAYLDDDDLYYPNHVETLVEVLENQTDCQVAYSDLYKSYCRIMPDGGRQVLSKVVEVSRDFDRLFMLYFNHVLHVSLMHRRDLLEKTGLYNEELTILIDWDMTRRLAFFSDFHHICDITGEFYSSVGESDRISVQRRKDKNEYRRNVLTIRTTRPAKPWAKIEDMSIIFVVDSLNQQAGKTLGLIWHHTFYPYKLYLPLSQADLSRVDTDMPNIIFVRVDPFSSGAEKIDAALAGCEGEYIVIVPSGFPVEEMWIEDPLNALINSSVSCQGFELERSTDMCWAAVLRKGDLQYARSSFPNLPVRESLRAAGIVLRNLRPEEIPFQFDSLFKEARMAEKDGNWAKAAEIFEYIADYHRNELWMRALAAKALYKAGSLTGALKLSSEVNQQRPTVNTLLLEAKVNREKKDFSSAIELLERAEQILEGPIPLQAAEWEPTKGKNCYGCETGQQC
jgi:glycosyltransferase involved in cell wall biosynthesis